jgi:DNA-binding transcriptional ArsR family regulator
MEERPLMKRFPGFDSSGVLGVLKEPPPCRALDSGTLFLSLLTDSLEQGNRERGRLTLNRARSSLGEQTKRGNEGQAELRLAEAMGHPVRGKLLHAVAEKSEEGVSIRQLAARLAEPKRRIRYHLDALSDLGLVEVVRVANCRGAIERFYGVTVTPWITEELADREQARQVYIHCLKAVLADVHDAIGAKLFGQRPGNTVIRIPMEVDRKGWAELVEIQNRALHEANEAAGRSRDRLRTSSEARISALAAMLLFEVPPWPQPNKG